MSYVLYVTTLTYLTVSSRVGHDYLLTYLLTYLFTNLVNLLVGLGHIVVKFARQIGS